MLREALESEPDAPDLLNNLAMALRGQGKRAEAARILHDVQQRFPDYFFGQIALAQEQIDSGDHDAAQRPWPSSSNGPGSTFRSLPPSGPAMSVWPRLWATAEKRGCG